MQLAPQETLSGDGGGEPPALTACCRALLVLAGVGLSAGIGVGLVLLKEDLVAYLSHNTMPTNERRFVLGMGFGTAALTTVSTLVVAWRRRRRFRMSTTLERVARRFAPLGVLGFLPILFQWKVWKDRDLSFLVLVTATTLAFEAGVRTAISAGPLAWELPVRRLSARIVETVRSRFPRALASVPLFLVCTGALGYAAYFGYATIAWHWGVRSGQDLGVENNLMWNLVHGGQFFKSSPLLGPKGSHFGDQATLFAFVMAPLYALAQRPETLLASQSVLIAFAAVPLFLFARLHLGSSLACVVSLAYLLYPGVAGANLYEFHYLPLGAFFLFTTLYLLESRRDALALIAVLITISVHEDVAGTLAIWGIYLLLTGRRAGVGLALALVSTGYFIVMKMAVMPRFASAGNSAVVFQKLLPAGETSFAAVLKTVVGNPLYTLGTLLDESKLIYVLQVLVPLAFIPMRRPLSVLFALPGVLFTLLPTGYSPAISIHHQYTASWIPFLFVGMVLVLERLGGVRRAAAVGALGLSLAACTYQYGSMLQTQTNGDGPVRYKFGIGKEDRRRHRALDTVIAHLPRDAKVAGSSLLTPQVSSRRDAYSLAFGAYDAEYLLFPSERTDFLGKERQTVTDLLSSGGFGIVVVERPFALARRGHSTALNEELLGRIR